MNYWLDIGSSPPDEPCAQLGTANYRARAHHECKVYLRLLLRVLGTEPDGARLDIRSHPHDFGNYLSVVCYYDPTVNATVEYAFRCERDGPSTWDDEARCELADQKGSAS